MGTLKVADQVEAIHEFLRLIKALHVWLLAYPLEQDLMEVLVLSLSGRPAKQTGGGLDP